MKSWIKNGFLVLCMFIVLGQFAAYASYTGEEKKVEETTIEIYDAIKDIDPKRVVSLSDYNGTYDTRYLDMFFAKYDGSKEIVKSLLDTLQVDIKNIEKIDSSRYKVSLHISMIDVNKLIGKISLKVGMDILKSRFSMSKNPNDIINIVLKRIDEVPDKDKFDKIDFDYNVDFVYVGGSYKLCSQKIISDISDKIKPFLALVDKKIAKIRQITSKFHQL